MGNPIVCGFDPQQEAKLQEEEQSHLVEEEPIPDDDGCEHLAETQQTPETFADDDNNNSSHSSPRDARCPCCHYRTLHERGEDEICRVCWWHDDGQDDHDADDSRGGPNIPSLTEARWNYARYGASYQGGIGHVRPPRDTER